MPWKDPNDRRAKRATQREELRAYDRAWYQQNAERVRAKRRAKRAEWNANNPRPPKPPPDHAAYLARKRADGRKRRLNPVYCEASAVAAKAWRDENPERMRALNKVAKARQLAQQEAVAGRPRPLACDICRRPGRRIHFDHDHQGGGFRGWLCGQCNLALGLVQDDTDVLRKMIAYLERTQT